MFIFVYFFTQTDPTRTVLAEFFLCPMSLSQGSATFRFLFWALLFVRFFCRRLFANFFDLRSWLSVSLPFRSVGTPSPLPRGSCFVQPGNNLEPCTDFLALCRRALHLRKSEQRKFGYQMLSANSTKRDSCSVLVIHIYSQACPTAFI